LGGPSVAIAYGCESVVEPPLPLPVTIKVYGVSGVSPENVAEKGATVVCEEEGITGAPFNEYVKLTAPSDPDHLTRIVVVVTVDKKLLAGAGAVRTCTVFAAGVEPPALTALTPSV